MDPWEQAKASFLVQLDPVEQSLFASADAQSVLNIVREADRIHKRDSKGRAMGEKIQPVVSAIDQYAKALDILANSSDILSPLWGSLRVLLHIAQEFGKYFEKIVDMLERIGDVLPRYNTYMILFREHEPLQKALAAAYLDILRFSTDAKKIFVSVKSPSKSSSSVFVALKLLWKPFNEQFGSVLDGFRRHRKLVEKEAQVADMLASSRERKEARNERDMARKERELAATDRQHLQSIESTTSTLEKYETTRCIRHWVLPVTCEDDFERMNEQLLPGSCDWILCKKEYLYFVAHTQHPSIPEFYCYPYTLWITGIPGCGKTFIFTRIISSLKHDGVPLAYFFCKGTDNRRNTSTAIIRSWLFQLATCFPAASSIIHDLAKAGEHAATPRDLFNALILVLEAVPTTYLAVDALDEITDNEILRLVQKMHPKHRFLVVSRETMPRRFVEDAYPRPRSIRITAEDVTKDIENYIAHRLETDFLMFDKEDVLYKKIHTKLQSCEGMFLWVRLMLDHLLTQTTAQELSDALDELPQGLDEAFSAVMRHVNSFSRNQQLLAKKVFLWVSTVERPLSLIELRTALALQPGDDKIDTNRFVLNPESTITTLCGPLIEIVEVGKERSKKVVRTVHFTVNQYLKKYLADSQIVKEIAGRYIPPIPFESADGLIGAVCLTSLTLADSVQGGLPCDFRDAEEIHSRIQTCPVSFISYSTFFWFQHVRRSLNEEGTKEIAILKGLLNKFMNFGQPYLEYWWRLYWFSASDANESRSCPGMFSPLHVTAYLGLEQVLVSLVEDLKRTPSESLAEKYRDSHGRCPLWWASSLGHTKAVEVLLQYGFRPDAADLGGLTPLHRAVTNGFSPVTILHLKWLHSNQESERHHFTDADGWTPLHWIASTGRTDIARTVLEYNLQGPGDYASMTNRGQTPLHLASLHSHLPLIALLVTHTPKNQQDNTYSTALHLAARQGHIDAVKILSFHIDPTICDSSGKTALDWARVLGYDEIVEFLLHHSESYMSEANPDLAFTVGTYERLVAYDLERIEASAPSSMELNSRDSLDSFPLNATVDGHSTYLELLTRGKGRGRGRLDATDHRGRTPLFHAVIRGDVSIIDSMRTAVRFRPDDKGSLNFNHKDHKGWTALHFAVVCGHTEMVEYLLDSGAVLYPNDDGKTPLDLAVAERHLTIADIFEGHIAPEQVARSLGWSSLHSTARHGDLESMKTLIRTATETEISTKDRCGRTPLVLAAQSNHLKIVKELAMLGYLLPEERLQALLLATERMHGSVVEYLLDDPSWSHAISNTEPAGKLLRCAISNRNEVLARKVLELGTDPNIQETLRHGSAMLEPILVTETLLHTAIRKQYHELLVLLLQSKADITIADSRGYLPLHRAATGGQVEMAKILLQFGADVNCRVQAPPQHHYHEWETNVDGYIPLHCAIESGGPVEMVEVLVSEGADLCAQDNMGRNALEFARISVTPYSKPEKGEVLARLELYAASRRFRNITTLGKPPRNEIIEGAAESAELKRHPSPHTSEVESSDDAEPNN